MAKFNDLPEEIILDIVTFFAYQKVKIAPGYLVGEQPPALGLWSLCCVSKQMYRIVSPYLAAQWHGSRFDYLQDYYDPDIDKVPRLDESIYGYISYLLNFPAARANAQHLTIRSADLCGNPEQRAYQSCYPLSLERSRGKRAAIHARQSRTSENLKLYDALQHDLHFKSCKNGKDCYFNRSLRLQNFSLHTLAFLLPSLVVLDLSIEQRHEPSLCFKTLEHLLFLGQDGHGESQKAPLFFTSLKDVVLRYFPGPREWHIPHVHNPYSAKYALLLFGSLQSVRTLTLYGITPFGVTYRPTIPKLDLKSNVEELYVHPLFAEERMMEHLLVPFTKLKILSVIKHPLATKSYHRPSSLYTSWLESTAKRNGMHLEHLTLSIRLQGQRFRGPLLGFMFLKSLSINWNYLVANEYGEFRESPDKPNLIDVLPSSLETLEITHDELEDKSELVQRQSFIPLVALQRICKLDEFAKECGDGRRFPKMRMFNIYSLFNIWCSCIRGGYRQVFEDKPLYKMEKEAFRTVERLDSISRTVGLEFIPPPNKYEQRSLLQNPLWFTLGRDISAGERDSSGNPSGSTAETQPGSGQATVDQITQLCDNIQI